MSGIECRAFFTKEPMSKNTWLFDWRFYRNKARIKRILDDANEKIADIITGFD